MIIVCPRSRHYSGQKSNAKHIKYRRDPAKTHDAAAVDVYYIYIYYYIL